MAFPSIVSALKDIEFPINKEDLIKQAGDREIEVLPNGQTLSMRELLNACSQNRYENPSDVVKCPEIVHMIEETQMKAA